MIKENFVQLTEIRVSFCAFTNKSLSQLTVNEFNSYDYTITIIFKLFMEQST